MLLFWRWVITSESMRRSSGPAKVRRVFISGKDSNPNSLTNRRERVSMVSNISRPYQMPQ